MANFLYQMQVLAEEFKILISEQKLVTITYFIFDIWLFLF